MFLGISSVGGAFVSGCPFRSAISRVTRFILEKPQTMFKWILRGCLSSKSLQRLWIGTLVFLWCGLFFVSNTVVADTTFNTSTWASIMFLLVAIPLPYLAQRKTVHKPQKYIISHMGLSMFLSTSVIMAFPLLMTFPKSFPVYFLGGMLILWSFFIFSKMSKSMADTGEIDAIAW